MKSFKNLKNRKYNWKLKKKFFENLNKLNQKRISIKMKKKNVSIKQKNLQNSKITIKFFKTQKWFKKKIFINKKKWNVRKRKFHKKEFRKRAFHKKRRFKIPIRFKYRWKVKKIKRKKKLYNIIGFKQQGFIKTLFKMKSFSLLQNKIFFRTNNFKDKTRNKDYIIFAFLKKKYKKKKKRKLLKNVTWRIKRKKKRKFRKISLRLRKKIKKIYKRRKKNVIFSKNTEYILRVKYKKKNYFVVKNIHKKNKKWKKKKNRSKAKKIAYKLRFKPKNTKQKKKSKFFYKRYKKNNKYKSIVNEFMYLWKQKHLKRNKITIALTKKKFMKIYKKKTFRFFNRKRQKFFFKERLITKFYNLVIRRRLSVSKIEDELNPYKLKAIKIAKCYQYIKKKKKRNKFFFLKKKQKAFFRKKFFKIIKNSVLLRKIKTIIKTKFIRIYKKKKKNHNNFHQRFYKLLFYFFNRKNRKEKKRLYKKKFLYKRFRKKKNKKIFFDKKITIKNEKEKALKKRIIYIIRIQNRKKDFKTKIWRKSKAISKKIFCEKVFFLTRKKENFKTKKLLKFEIIKRKINKIWKFAFDHKLKRQVKTKLKNLIWKKEKTNFKINFNVSREKKKHHSWEKTKQRLKFERKIKLKRKRKNQKRLRLKKITKIKNKMLIKNTKINTIKLKFIKKIFNRKAKIYFQKKKKHLKNTIFIKKKKKHKKLIFYIFKTKKWNIQLNNKTSRTFRNKRKTKKYGRSVKKNRIFFYIKNIQSGKIIRRRKKVFKLRETLKKFIKKINSGLPNNLKNYFSNPNKKKKQENLEYFSNKFINNINILLYRIGIFPSLSLSIEAIKRNWICVNFETGVTRNNIINIGDSITLFPSFDIYSNYLWSKRMFIKQLFYMSCDKQEFFFSRKPLLFFFIKIRKKNLIINNTPKDWIKLSFLKNLKLIP